MLQFELNKNLGKLQSLNSVISLDALNFAGAQGLLHVLSHFLQTNILGNLISKCDNSIEQKKGNKTSECETSGAVFEYGQGLLLLMCPELLRCDGSKPEHCRETEHLWN